MRCKNSFLVMYSCCNLSFRSAVIIFICKSELSEAIILVVLVLVGLDSIQGVRKITIQSYKLLYRHPVIY